PSIMLVVFGDVMQVPVGDLFAATLIPGVMLAGFYVLYIIYNALFQPHKVPANKVTEVLPVKGIVLRVLRDLIVPALLISSVLVSIVLGIATPTEGAAIGAGCALLLALAKR